MLPTPYSRHSRAAPATIVAVVLIIGLLSGAPLHGGTLMLPRSALAPHQIGIVYNLNDLLSRRAAEYYRVRRGIPAANVVGVSLPFNQPRIEPGRFAVANEQVRAALPSHVQALAIAWARPYGVGCMSVTTAFATAYDHRYCARRLPDKPCGISGSSPYFDSPSHHPYRDHGLRPSMLLAALDESHARALIERGIAADASFPDGTAYLLSTSDRNRNVRAAGFARIAESLGKVQRVQILEQNVLRDADDVLFYFTGLKQVEGLDSLEFLPGAIADHLTSSGGRLQAPGEGRQMSSLRWLEAGATGSYGTVIEPCNFTAKFPDPRIVIDRYRAGESLVEAYWKSVAWPGEGVFIGEPLAAPFFRPHIAFDGERVEVPLGQFDPGRYRLESATAPVGPYRDTGRRFEVARGDARLLLAGLVEPFYRLRIDQSEVGVPFAAVAD